jgi:hypothetical protein
LDAYLKRHLINFRQIAAAQFLVYFLRLSKIEENNLAIETNIAAKAKDPKEYLKIHFQDKVKGNFCYT